MYRSAMPPDEAANSSPQLQPTKLADRPPCGIAKPPPPWWALMDRGEGRPAWLLGGVGRGWWFRGDCSFEISFDHLVHVRIEIIAPAEHLQDVASTKSLFRIDREKGWLQFEKDSELLVVVKGVRLRYQIDEIAEVREGDRRRFR